MPLDPSRWLSDLLHMQGENSSRVRLKMSLGCTCFGFEHAGRTDVIAGIDTENEVLLIAA